MLKKITKNFMILLMFGGIIFFSCSDNSTETKTQKEENHKDGELNIIVSSDWHYFSPTLGIGQESYYYDKKSETKLSEESKYIIEAYVGRILQESSDILIICGDMTHNGEFENHLEVVKLLHKLESNGKRVFVIPGNHDIDNPASFRYMGSSRIKVPSINAKEFEELYADFGYREAYSRDLNSLSYAVALNSKFVLIGIDACKYKENTNTTAESSGRISELTLQWLESQILNAKKEGRIVLAAMHHGLIEHFPGQSVNPITSSYILENSKDLVELFAENGVKLVFTGHFHANDIAKFANSVFDIETGSALTYPHSYRKISIKDYALTISTRNIESIDYNTKGIPFAEYSRQRTINGLENYFNHTWKSVNKNYPVAVENRLRLEFAKAVLAHYSGDEKMDAETSSYVLELIKSEDSFLQLIGIAVNGIYTDSEPADRELIIDLK